MMEASAPCSARRRVLGEGLHAWFLKQEPEAAAPILESRGHRPPYL